MRVKTEEERGISAQKEIKELKREWEEYGCTKLWMWFIYFIFVLYIIFVTYVVSK